MSRLRLLVVAFAAACLGLAAGRSIAAQPATPQAETGVEMPAGITRQDLAVGSAAPLLPEGAIIELSASPLPQELSWSSPRRAHRLPLSTSSRVS